jgi:hypothetical protein
LLAQLHAPDLAYHFHGDHFLALLLKYSAEQLNTLVNFESALLGLEGVQLNSWTGLCCKSQAFSVLDGTE